MEHLNKNRLLVTGFAFVSMTLLGACAPKAGSDTSQRRSQLELKLQDLSQRISNAESQSFRLLSPSHTEKAERHYQLAVAEAKSAGRLGEAEKDAASSEEHLKEAEAQAAKVRPAFQLALDARERAIQNGAATYKPEQLKSVDQSGIPVGVSLERKGQAGATDELTALVSRYNQLSAASLQARLLSEPRQLIELAKKENAKKYVPKTLAETEKDFKDTQAFISTSMNQTEAIENKSRDLLNHSKYLVALNRLSRDWDHLSAEERVLRMRAYQMQIAQASGRITDPSQVSWDQAVRSVEELRSERDRLTAVVGPALSEEALEKKFQAARRMFTPREAQVYRSGDRVIVQLKDLRFKVGKANIDKPQQRVLDKIVKLSSELGPQRLVVEGHTDSSGPRALNEALSHQRAQAVKDYLSQNAQIAHEQIITTGVGFEEPIAADRSAAGRAINRRTDIIFELGGSANEPMPAGQHLPQTQPQEPQSEGQTR